MTEERDLQCQDDPNEHHLRHVRRAAPSELALPGHGQDTDGCPVFPAEAVTPISYGNLYNRVLIPTLRSAGIGLSFASSQVGCCRRTTTLNVYQHELDDGLGGADALDEVWGQG